MRTIRWGMIGCGDVAEVKSGPALYKARNSRLIAVMRRNGALAEDYARRHGVPRWHDDADAIIEAPDLDAVYIATHTDSHREYTLRCAAAGKPVYVEKPMAMDHAECLEMIGACRAAGVPLWVAYYRRALPRLLAVRDLLQSGAIGDVRIADVRHFERPPPAAELAAGRVPWRVNESLSGGGFFFEGACHTLDALDFLLGPVTDVRAFAGNLAGRYRPEDTVAASFRFASGAYGSGAWCFASDVDEEWVELVGSRGSLRFSIRRPLPIRVVRDGERHGTHGEGPPASEELDVPDPPHVQQPLVQTIVDELDGVGSCPSTGETAARTAWVQDQILREHRAGMAR